ncbi:hypothetical protein BGX28_009897 [Mortierella sp. GBA30]|nr:hypothetical protein BGX28_009897 [Mortierella sp. GBA30]
MGLSGFFQALKAKGFEFEAADLSGIMLDAVVDIELLGTSWFRNNLLGQLTDHTAPYSAGIKFGALIRSLFGRRILRVHVEGGRNLKKIARAERNEDFVTNLKEIDTALDRMAKRADQGKFVNATVIRTIEGKLKQVYVLADPEKQYVCKGLSATVEVCRCRTEAELCIARFKDHGSRPKIVVSGDSDIVG